MSEYTHYPHHGVMVHVRKDLKGRHREHCLCYSCEKFKPNTIENCVIAQDTFENCLRHDLVTPIWECPAFVVARGNTSGTVKTITLTPDG